jgi:hypothetical protein
MLEYLAALAFFGLFWLVLAEIEEHRETGRWR